MTTFIVLSIYIRYKREKITRDFVKSVFFGWYPEGFNTGKDCNIIKHDF